MFGYVYFIQGILAFLITFFFLKRYVPLAINRGYVGKDVHKVNKPSIPEMGGFGIIFGFLFGLGIAYPFLHLSQNHLLISAVFSVVLAAFTGVFDDLFSLTPTKKIILLFIGAIPLVITKSGDTSIILPIFGSTDIDLLYTLIFLPLFFNVFCNMTNMLAGYNGLEASLGIVTLISYLIVAVILNKTLVIVMIVPFLASLIAFYLFNKYPAKVFPGDIGTLSIGSVIASSAIISGSELIVIILTVLYIINFSMYFIYKFIYPGFLNPSLESSISSVDKNGILERQYFDKQKTKIQWHKLYFLFEHLLYPLTEKEMVKKLVIIHIILNVIGIIGILIIY